MGARHIDEGGLSCPGWVIPVVWFGLFLLLAVARWRLLALAVPAAQTAAALIVGLAVFCATYAYYTLGLAKLTGVDPLVLGMVGNLVTIATATAVAWRCAALLPLAALLVLPVAVWTAFATVIVIGLMRLPR
ncbi:tryptophan-rich sensory protein [Luteitalea sp.]